MVNPFLSAQRGSRLSPKGVAAHRIGEEGTLHGQDTEPQLRDSWGAAPQSSWSTWFLGMLTPQPLVTRATTDAWAVVISVVAVVLWSHKLFAAAGELCLLISRFRGKIKQDPI